MKIGIEAQRIFRKKKHGMDIVVLEMIKQLQQLDHINEYVVFVRPDEDDKVLSETPNFKIVPLKAPNYVMWEQWALPRAAAAHGCHILHCTGNTGPLISSVPVVVTLHDIIYLEKSALAILTGSGSAYQRFGNVYRRLIVPALLKKAKKVITVSEFEKACIQKKFLQLPGSNITVAHNGVSNIFKPAVSENVLQSVKSKYQLPENYFFFMGNTHPKKNTEGVLTAFAEYKRSVEDDTKLVMIDFDKTQLRNLLPTLNAQEIEKDIVLTGYLSHQDLPAVYAGSRLFLYPSLRESFGLPVVEAMACGTPVITSNTSSMPEVGGKAACLVNPFEPSDISSAMQAVNSNQPLREKMIQEGLAQAKSFSWGKTACIVSDVYAQIEREVALS